MASSSRADSPHNGGAAERSGVSKGNKYNVTVPGQNQPQKINRPREKGAYADELISPVRSRRNVWQINTCSAIMAGISQRSRRNLRKRAFWRAVPSAGLSLTPFSAAARRASVAKRLNRRYIGIEINPEYCELAKQRIGGDRDEQGMESPRQGNAKNDPRRWSAENLTTGETSSISERPQERERLFPSAAAGSGSGKGCAAYRFLVAEIERHAAKGAEKKALDATQPKTHSSRLQFSEAERATPELQKAIKKSDKAADCLDAARAAIPKEKKLERAHF